MQQELFKQKEIDRIRELEKKVIALEKLATILKIIVDLDRNGPKINPDRKYAEDVQSEFWV